MTKKNCKFCWGLEKFQQLGVAGVSQLPSELLVADLPTSVAVLSMD